MQLSPEPADNIHFVVSKELEATGRTGERAGIDPPLLPESEPGQESILAQSLEGKKRFVAREFWRRWSATLKAVLPVYIAIHLALLAISCLAFMFINKDFSGQIMPVASLWQQWRRWDSEYYIAIATQGYARLQYMAFFPLYPLLMRGVMTAVSDPVLAGLLVTNVAELVMFTVLYRLVEEDFGADRAYHTVLYFAIFPSAFFLSAVYTEALFLCFSTLSFYQIRRGRWLLAGIFAACAGLTRPDGMYLVIPFCYEYLSRIWLRRGLSLRAVLIKGQIFALLKGLRFDILSALCFLGGLALFMAYGLVQFHDPLAFMHAHSYWSRIYVIPGWGLWRSLWSILHHGFLSFTTMRNVLDLGTALFILSLIVLSFIGPWRLPARLWSYSLYALVLFIYFQLVPVAGNIPLESLMRFLLEIFPAFIFLSALRKYRTIHLGYCLVAGALLFFMLTQFLTGHWIT